MHDSAQALRGKKLLLVGFTLFSMFFGAGNLIFPPFLGAQAGTCLLYTSVSALPRSTKYSILHRNERFMKKAVIFDVPRTLSAYSLLFFQMPVL